MEDFIILGAAFLQAFLATLFSTLLEIFLVTFLAGAFGLIAPAATLRAILINKKICLYLYIWKIN